jgi:hypothetical protein
MIALEPTVRARPCTRQAAIGDLEPDQKTIAVKAVA